MDAAAPQPVRRADYRPPPHRIERVALEFDLDAEETRVRARLETRREAAAPAPLVLDGEDLALDSVRVNGVSLTADDYEIAPGRLVLADPGETAVVEIETRCRPADNTRLEGLYRSGGMFCTQCEAEGFRRIAWFVDRPDVMAVYTTTLIADRETAPVLLSNGNLVETRDLGDGRHLARWHDPFPKPSYLFALVAGDLAVVEDRFVTASGREVTLRLYVERGNESRCGFALGALKRAMRWDEETYGLEYDLDLFNIVAVADFNMGAMENKSLNVFNARYVLADPETATDADYAFVEAVVAHEYFHNWTGNRITCRDWFQLSLKEGLTVFRDRQFSADARSPAVKRIEDARALRARQFREDSGPLAHPVRPESYIEINNFYTATVYEKGAEVVGMLHTLLGPDGFRRGMDAYVARHDGEAATCDQFVAAMADANGRDLGRFMRWYAQAGTPEVTVSGAWDAAARSYALVVVQRTPPTPDQAEKEPLHMPFAVALLGRGGRPLPLRLAGEPAAAAAASRVLELTGERHVFRFVDVDEAPVPSLNRGFSAPVRLKTDRGEAELAFLLACDDDPFSRWDAGRQLALDLLLGMVDDIRAARPMRSPEAYVEALRGVLARAPEDRALAAETLRLPSADVLADRMSVVDVEAIHAAREGLRSAVAAALESALADAYRASRTDAPYRPDAAGAARRALANQALHYLARAPSAAARGLVARQYRAADNMTDRFAALALLADEPGEAREAALADFYGRFRDAPAAVDKWLAVQARSTLPETLERVRALLAHEAFSPANPNKVRALIAAFADGNPLRFHAASGAGYAFLADRVLALDGRNPQLAARLLAPFGRWRRFDAGRRSKMRAALERILAAPGLSRDAWEIASKALA